MHGWQANKKRTCAQPKKVGLCPKKKNHRLSRWMFISGYQLYPDVIGHDLKSDAEPFFRTACRAFRN